MSLGDKDKERNRGDYLAPFIIGFLELLAFPILFAAGPRAMRCPCSLQRLVRQI